MFRFSHPSVKPCLVGLSLVTLVACAGHSQVNPRLAIPAPLGTVAQVTLSSREVLVAWQGPDVPVMGYRTEVLEPGGTFKPFKPYKGDWKKGVTPQVVYQVPDHVPDLAELQFRVIALAEGGCSNPSPVATCTLRVKQPLGLLAQNILTDTGRCLQLSWDPPTDPATRWRLERTEMPASGDPVILKEGGLEPGAGPLLYNDQQVEEGHKYLYRIVFKKGDVESLPQETVWEK